MTVRSGTTAFRWGFVTVCTTSSSTAPFFLRSAATLLTSRIRPFFPEPVQQLPHIVLPPRHGSKTMRFILSYLRQWTRSDLYLDWPRRSIASVLGFPVRAFMAWSLALSSSREEKKELCEGFLDSCWFSHSVLRARTTHYHFRYLGCWSGGLMATPAVTSSSAGSFRVVTGQRQFQRAMLPAQQRNMSKKFPNQALQPERHRPPKKGTSEAGRAARTVVVLNTVCWLLPKDPRTALARSSAAARWCAGRRGGGLPESLVLHMARGCT